MFLAMLMLVPLLIGIGGMVSSKGKLNWIEFAVMEIVVLAVMGLGFAISRYTATADTELWSGRITGKDQVTVSCSHSYSCNCRPVCSGTGKSQSCTTECDTCYRHSNDYDWDLFTNIGSTITIDRIDEQGVSMPRRWSKAFVNEPVVVAHTFTNYIKANPASVLLRRGVKDTFKVPIPDDPVDVYDYYRVKRFLAIGYGEPHEREWNWLLDELNATYGPTKQVNVIVVAAKTSDPNFAYEIEQKWLGGKKNDLIVVLGVPEYPKIAWARVISWSKVEDMKVQVRDAIQDIGTMQKRDDIMAVIHEAVQTKWQRRHMKEFEYLMAGVEPGPVATIFLFLVGLGLTIGMTIYFWKNDPFGKDEQRYRYNSSGRSNIGRSNFNIRFNTQFPKRKGIRHL